MVAVPQVPTVFIEQDIAANLVGVDIHQTMRAMAGKFAGPQPPTTDPDLLIDWQDWLDTSVAGQITWRLWDSTSASWLEFLRVSTSAGVWVTGDVKTSLRENPEPGWIRCDGTLYDSTAADYTPLFLVLGTRFNQPGDPAGFFRVPNQADKTMVAASNTRPLATEGGAETATLGVPNLPSHNHGLTQVPHSHAATANDHAHFFQHDHAHIFQYPLLQPQDGGEPGRFDDSNAYPQNRATQSATVAGWTGGSNNRGVAVSANTINISVNAAGGGQPFPIFQPYIAVNFFIKL